MLAVATVVKASVVTALDVLVFWHEIMENPSMENPTERFNNVFFIRLILISIPISLVNAEYDLSYLR